MKKKLTIVLFGLLLGIGIAGTFWGPQLVEAASFWDSCRKVTDLCYYPGKCRSYIDTNGDNICDRSQPEPVQTSASSSSSTAADTTKAEIVTASVIPFGTDDDDEAAAVPVPTDTAGVSGDEAVAPRGSVYYFLPIILPTVILYGITWLASKKRKIPLSLHRKIWNFSLLVPALVSCIFGIILTAEIEFGATVNLPFDITFWHVEAGIIMGTITVLHIAWHWKYFAKALQLAKQDR